MMTIIVRWTLIAACMASMPSSVMSDELARKAEALRNVKYLHDEYFSDFHVTGVEIGSVVKDYVGFKANEMLCSKDQFPSIENIVENALAEIHDIVSFLRSYTDQAYTSGETELTLKFKFENAFANDKCDQTKQWTTPLIIRQIKILEALEFEIAKREAEIVEMLASQ